MSASITVVLIIAVIILNLFFKAVHILNEYERGVVFALGRFWKVKGPGLILIIPYLQTMQKIELRTFVEDVDKQKVITKDNVTISVDAVMYYRISDPKAAIIQVQDFVHATSMIAQTTLRSTLGQHELDEILVDREKLNNSIRQTLDQQTNQWGIQVINVEIKDIDLTENMVSAMAKQAEAERDRRAKVIHAEGEMQAASKLTEAATILEKQAGAIQLRYLQTLTSIANDKTNTIVIPLPDLLNQMLAKTK